MATPEKALLDVTHLRHKVPFADELERDNLNKEKLASLAALFPKTVQNMVARFGADLVDRPARTGPWGRRASSLFPFHVPIQRAADGDRKMSLLSMRRIRHRSGQRPHRKHLFFQTMLISGYCWGLDAFLLLRYPSPNNPNGRREKVDGSGITVFLVLPLTRDGLLGSAGFVSSASNWRAPSLVLLVKPNPLSEADGGISVPMGGPPGFVENQSIKVASSPIWFQPEGEARSVRMTGGVNVRMRIDVKSRVGNRIRGIDCRILVLPEPSSQVELWTEYFWWRGGPGVKRQGKQSYKNEGETQIRWGSTRLPFHSGCPFS
jgi:hypothetical protein